MNIKTKTKKYNPSEEDEELVKNIYTALEEMIEKRNENYEEFNDVALKDYLDDSHKRINSYTPSREAQGKEDWQANIALPTLRTLMKKMIAPFSFQVPDLKIEAFGKENRINLEKGKIAEYLIKNSYIKEENPVLENYWETWENFINGTVIKYEGYLKTKYDQKFIQSYDIVTGEIEFDEREVNVDDKCISYLMPITELYIRDFYIYDIQDQPDLCWVRYMSESKFDNEFGQYPDAKYVETGKRLSAADTSAFYYKSKWEDRAGKERIEVVRYYNKGKDQYIIIANGILLLNAPMLWRINGKKVYPFAKTILEPFATKKFFYGKAFADIEMGLYDIYNTLFNTIMDKEYRSLAKPMLVGLVNTDALDLEDEYINSQTKISVTDVDQVKPMPVDAVDNADVSMLELVAGKIQGAAPSLPSLMQNKDATAREVVIAEEKIAQLKSIHKNMMVDLWRQKYYLRLANILRNYPEPRTVVDEEGEEEKIYKTYVIENAVLNPETDERGVLGIQFRNVPDSKRAEIEIQNDVEEEVMKKKGITYEKKVIDPDYFNNYRFRIEIVPESFYRTSMAKRQATTLEKLSQTAKMFPQIFQANQEQYFSQLAKAYDEDPKPALNNFGTYRDAMKEITKKEQTKRPEAR